jgi:hypothetical protein
MLKRLQNVKSKGPPGGSENPVRRPVNAIVVPRTVLNFALLSAQWRYLVRRWPLLRPAPQKRKIGEKPPRPVQRTPFYAWFQLCAVVVKIASVLLQIRIFDAGATSSA